MNTLRKWLVWQALLFWQGGFFFYSAVVVPTGTDVLGSFPQGQVTRVVTEWMNLIGILTLLLLAWDQLARRAPKRINKLRWVLWAIMALSLVALFVLHPIIGRYVDTAEDQIIPDFDHFYAWHRVYLFAATVIWLASLLWTFLEVAVADESVILGSSATQ